MKRTKVRIYRFLIFLSDKFFSVLHDLGSMAYLLSELTIWSLIMLFRRRGNTRKGLFTKNTLDYGLGAVPIIGIIMFLIGFITALQSAAQLRMVGGNIFVADLLAIGMTAEMGPLMAAIIVAGRSGSAIASEIATMKYTEELDALRTMGLNPIRFVMVPKMWAMVFSMPFLTMFANAMGILGGTVIAVTYLNLSFSAFWRELTSALMFEDIVSGTIKSVCFAVLITVVGSHKGLRFEGGADGVGRATTASVVTSIFFIIAADSLLGLIFYFN
jgi:phospholipid/cholesterol/gamma-HCH transport system permease protein